jgi:transposase InsO family protein
MKTRPKRGAGREVPIDVKVRVVEERLRGTPQEDVARAFGVSGAAVSKWLSQFRARGRAGLEPVKRGSKPTPKAGRTVQRERVVALKREHETWGTRRIRDVLERFEALGVSEQTVRRILHDEGLIETPKVAAAREHAPRRFERATPNQLWQSDIFTFRLRRAERLYVCVFMDDHSRFIVGYALAHHQKSALVMEAFERGVAAYGQPAEVLTDNGRQYTVWRGRTEFEEALTRMGIQHIRSRPQHPQTLGKVERFWKTLWDEFLGRTVFAHVVDAQHRLEHFISHYNFQRPHQALDGLVPADRFFKAAAHVRAEIERAVAANELRLALEQPPRKPFYVVGQLGDQRLSISAGEQGLQVHVGDTTQTIPLKEHTDEATTARHFTAAEATEPTDAALANEADGSGRGRAEPRDAGAVGAIGRETGVDGDRGERDLARLLLSARDQGDQRDAARDGTGRGWRFESGRDGIAPPDQGARGQAHARGTSTATRRAALARPAQADDRTCEDATRSAAEDLRDECLDDNILDVGWAERLALVDDDEGQVAAPVSFDGHGDLDAERYDEDRGNSDFDANAGWHERGPLMWERKLAGADALSDGRGEDANGQEPTSHVHTGPRATNRSGPAPALRRDHGSARTDADRQWSGGLDRDVAQSLPDDSPSCDRRDPRDADAQAGGPSGETSAGSGAGGGEHAPQSGAREPDGALGDDRATDGSRERDSFWQGALAAIARAIEEQDQEAERGPGITSEAMQGGDDDGDA